MVRTQWAGSEFGSQGEDLKAYLAKCRWGWKGYSGSEKKSIGWAAGRRSLIGRKRVKDLELLVGRAECRWQYFGRERSCSAAGEKPVVGRKSVITCGPHMGQV